MTKPICIYHGNCADGFGAAWAVWKKHPDWEFHAGSYQNAPPDVSGRDVVMVDFSYKRDVVEKMAKTARSILILDHHKSAAEDIDEIAQKAGTSWDNHQTNIYQDSCENADINGAIVYALFDMERSGAGIAWDYFHENAPRPLLINHIEDRDLWRFDMEYTREIQAALEIWDQLMWSPLGRLVTEGALLERKHHKDVAELVAVCRRKLRIGGHIVPAASLPYTLTSDAGHLMCEPIDHGVHGLECPKFAACYWDTAEDRVFSLRSDPRYGAADVSEIAKQYGGGGHKNAAGFRVPLAEIGQFEI